MCLGVRVFHCTTQCFVLPCDFHGTGGSFRGYMFHPDVASTVGTRRRPRDALVSGVVRISDVFSTNKVKSTALTFSHEIKRRTCTIYVSSTGGARPSHKVNVKVSLCFHHRLEARDRSPGVSRTPNEWTVMMIKDQTPNSKNETSNFPHTNPRQALYVQLGARRTRFIVHAHHRKACGRWSQKWDQVC